MAFSLGGLIGGAMKGVGEGYAKYGEVEMDKQAKIEYAERLTQLQEEKDKRIAELQSSLRKGEAEHASGLRLSEAEKLPAAAARGALAAAPDVGKAKVAGETAEIDAATTANLPTKRAALTKQTLEAEAPNAVLKAQTEGKAAGAGQVAKTGVKGYPESVAAEGVAKSAGERSVASINAAPHWAALSKPSIQSDGNGTYYTVAWDPKENKVTSSVVTGADGKPLKGPKDLDARTKLMAESMIAELKNDLDPESRKKTVQAVQDLLSGNQPPGANTPSNAAIDALKKDPSLADQFDAKYGAGASKKYLPTK